MHHSTYLIVFNMMQSTYCFRPVSKPVLCCSFLSLSLSVVGWYVRSLDIVSHAIRYGYKDKEDKRKR